MFSLLMLWSSRIGVGCTNSAKSLIIPHFRKKWIGEIKVGLNREPYCSAAKSRGHSCEGPGLDSWGQLKRQSSCHPPTAFKPQDGNSASFSCLITEQWFLWKVQRYRTPSLLMYCTWKCPSNPSRVKGIKNPLKSHIFMAQNNLWIINEK